MDEELDLSNSLLKDKKLPFGVMLKRTFPYIKTEWKSFVISLFLLLVEAGTYIILPLFQEKFISLLENLGVQTPLYRDILFYVFLYAGLTLVVNLSVYFVAMILARAGQRIVYRLRMEVFQHVEKMSQNQFNMMPVGSLVTRVATYTTSLSNMFTQTFVNFLYNGLTVIGVWFIMFFKSWVLSLVLLGFIVIIAAASYIFAKVITKIFSAERRSVSDMNTFLNESLSGMRIIQLFNQEDNKLAQFEKRNKKLRNARYNVVLAYGIYRPFMALIHFCAMACIFILGPRLALTGAQVIVFYSYLSTFFNPIQQMADQINEIQRGFTGLERLFNLLDIDPEVLDKPDAKPIGEVKGEIEFKHVWFAYVGEEWILKDVSFKIKAGDTCAFVGATGAGKTTILGLIVRNFEPQKGEILIDGVNINDLQLDSLRKVSGQMLQDVFLFSGKVRDNITLFDDSFTDEQVMEACKYVNADTFIEQLPNKLDENVEAHGENFSQGQRQLLSFARTVIHKPSILILDEATANIDTETESLIQDSLEKMRNIGTMLVVAHRLSTIQKADQIIVLHHGEILEKGTHQELLKLRGQYYKLYKLQFEEN